MEVIKTNIQSRDDIGPRFRIIAALLAGVERLSKFEQCNLFVFRSVANPAFFDDLIYQTESHKISIVDPVVVVELQSIWRASIAIADAVA
ncbi:hypothetical protein D3C72_1732470 [compost metagenome]